MRDDPVVMVRVTVAVFEIWDSATPGRCHGLLPGSPRNRDRSITLPAETALVGGALHCFVMLLGGCLKDCREPWIDAQWWLTAVVKCVARGCHGEGGDLCE